MTARETSISIDVDSIRAHLAGYDIESTDIEAVYHIALPRILSVLKDYGARATFFLIAGEAEKFPAAVQQIRDAGHEIACHTLTHPYRWNGDWSSVAQEELVRARQQLEAIVGMPVVGFRAPGWTWSNELVESLANSGYRYDASLFPSWFLLLNRLLVTKKLPQRNDIYAAFSSATAHHLGSRQFVELPLTTGAFRTPYYHTMKLHLPSACFSFIRQTALRNAAVQYIFHAVDFLELDDTVDRRIARHPGMKRKLKQKLDFARGEIEFLQAISPSRPLREILGY